MELVGILGLKHPNSSKVINIACRQAVIKNNYLQLTAKSCFIMKAQLFFRT